MTRSAITSFTGHRGAVYALAPGPGELEFLSAGGDGLVVHWRSSRPDEGSVVVNAGAAIYSLQYHDHSGRLFLGSGGGGLHVIDLVGGHEVKLMQLHRLGIFDITVLPGDRLITAGGDGTLSILDLSTLALIRQIPLCDEKLRGLAITPDGSGIAVACGDGTIRVLDADHFNEVNTIVAHAGGATAVRFHPLKPVLLSGGKDGHLRSWHMAEGYRPIHSIAAHRAAIYSIAFRPDGTELATASRDKTVKRWNAGTMETLSRLDRSSGGHSHSVNAVLWMGNLLISAGDDRLVLASDHSG